MRYQKCRLAFNNLNNFIAAHFACIEWRKEEKNLETTKTFFLLSWQHLWLWKCDSNYSIQSRCVKWHSSNTHNNINAFFSTPVYLTKNLREFAQKIISIHIFMNVNAFYREVYFINRTHTHALQSKSLKKKRKKKQCEMSAQYFSSGQNFSNSEFVFF